MSKVAISLMMLALLVGAAVAQNNNMSPQSSSNTPMQSSTNMSTQDSSNVDQTLTSLENKWTDAANKNDPNQVSSLLADKFINVDSDGTMLDKQQSLARMKNAKWQTNQVSDMKVVQYGNSAVVTGVWRGKGEVNGKQIDSTERFTDTWVKMQDGSWQCVASQSAPLKQMQTAQK